MIENESIIETVFPKVSEQKGGSFSRLVEPDRTQTEDGTDHRVFYGFRFFHHDYRHVPWDSHGPGNFIYNLRLHTKTEPVRVFHARQTMAGDRCVFVLRRAVIGPAGGQTKHPHGVSICVLVSAVTDHVLSGPTGGY